MRPAPWPPLLSVVVAALACASCALSSERPEERATAWARAYLDARCRYHLRCEVAFGAFAEREQVVCHPASWLADLEERAARVDDTFSFDEARAARCLAAIEGAPCSVALGTPYDEDIRGCDEVITGSVPDGGACDPSIGGRCLPWVSCPAECADGGTCVAEAGACGGVCRPPARRGESCHARPCEAGTQCRLGGAGEALCRAVDLAPGAECVEGEECRQSDGVAHTCVEGRCAPVPIAAEGEPCGASVRCEDDAVCSLSVCVVRVGEGETCRSDECLAGLWCDGSSGERRCAVLAPGECRSPSDCPVETPYCVVGDRGFRCSDDATAQPCNGGPAGAWAFQAQSTCPDTHRCLVLGLGTALCQPIVAEGAACDAGHACEDGTRCEGDRCVRIVGPAEGCGANAVCPTTHRCEDGACAPLPALGDACDGACFEGGCRDGVCVLLEEGESCDGLREGFAAECRGWCRFGTCADIRVDAGEPCGLSLGACARELACISRSDGTGVCTEECSE